MISKYLTANRRTTLTGVLTFAVAVLGYLGNGDVSAFASSCSAAVGLILAGDA